MVQRLAAIFIRYIVGFVCAEVENRGTGEGPSFEALSRRVACLFRGRSDQKATFAWGDFIDARLSSRDGRQSKGAATIHVRLQIARPEPADAAI